MGKLLNRNKLKPWASKQYQYTKAVQEELAQMKGDVSDKQEKFLSIKQSLDRAFKGLLNKTGMKNGRQKKQRKKRKAEKGEKERLNKIQE